MHPTKMMAALMTGVALATSAVPVAAQPAPGKITSAGYLGGIGDARSAMYAGAENVNTLEACKNFGLAIVSNYVSPYPQGGTLMCFDANKLVVAKFYCKGTETFSSKPSIPAYCTPMTIPR